MPQVPEWKKTKAFAPASRIDGNHRSPDDRPGQHGVYKFRMVTHEHGKGIAFLKSAVQQQAGYFVGPGIKIGIGEDVFPVFCLFEYQDFIVGFVISLHFNQMRNDGLV